MNYDHENADSYCVDCKRVFSSEELAAMPKGGQHQQYNAEAGMHYILRSECAE